jgi:small-conductance mechanosensitive channel
MADIVHDPRLADWELRAHRQTFRSFNKLVLFAILHVGLVLGCLALAFPGNTPVLATMLGVGGTIALIVGFAAAA